MGPARDAPPGAFALVGTLTLPEPDLAVRVLHLRAPLDDVASSRRCADLEASLDANVRAFASSAFVRRGAGARADDPGAGAGRPPTSTPRASARCSSPPPRRPRRGHRRRARGGGRALPQGHPRVVPRARRRVAVGAARRRGGARRPARRLPQDRRARARGASPNLAVDPPRARALDRRAAPRARSGPPAEGSRGLRGLPARAPTRDGGSRARLRRRRRASAGAPTTPVRTKPRSPRCPRRSGSSASAASRRTPPPGRLARRARRRVLEPAAATAVYSCVARAEIQLCPRRRRPGEPSPPDALIVTAAPVFDQEARVVSFLRSPRGVRPAHRRGGVPRLRRNRVRRPRPAAEPDDARASSPAARLRSRHARLPDDPPLAEIAFPGVDGAATRHLWPVSMLLTRAGATEVPAASRGTRRAETEAALDALARDLGERRRVSRRVRGSVPNSLSSESTAAKERRRRPRRYRGRRTTTRPRGGCPRADPRGGGPRRLRSVPSGVRPPPPLSRPPALAVAAPPEPPEEPAASAPPPRGTRPEPSSEPSRRRGVAFARSRRGAAAEPLSPRGRTNRSARTERTRRRNLP